MAPKAGNIKGGTSRFSFLKELQANDPGTLRRELQAGLSAGKGRDGWQCPVCRGNRLTFKDDEPVCCCQSGGCFTGPSGGQASDLIALAKAMGIVDELADRLGYVNGHPKPASSSNGHAGPAKAKKSKAAYRSLDDAVEALSRHNELVVPYPYSSGRHYVLRVQSGKLNKEGKKEKVAYPLTLGDDGLWRTVKGDGLWPVFWTREPVEGDVLIICEGEKAATAVGQCQSNFVGIASMGGSGRAKETDWATLPAGFPTYVFPDNDSSGTKYAKEVATLLGRETLLVIDVSSLPKKGDAADLLAGLGPEEAEEKLEDFLRANAKPLKDYKDELANLEGATSRTTELSNVDRFLQRHSTDVRFTTDTGDFLAWNGKRWARDPKKTAVRAMMGKVSRWVDEEVLAVPQGAAKAELRDWANQCEKKSTIFASVDLIPTRKSVWASSQDFDQHHELFNCPNGTVNLRTGQLMPHSRADMITRMALTDYKPGALHPLWSQTVELFMPDPEVREYMQRIVGYSLTGYSEKVFPVLWGGGNNGKGSIFETIGKMVMGPDYCASVSPDVITDGDKPQAAERANVKFYGKRLALFEETEEGDSLTNAIKRLASGGDVMEGRHLYGESFNFTPTHSLLLMTNHEPRLNTFDVAMKTRIKFINFGVTVPRNEQIRRQLETDPGVRMAALAWAVQGAVAYLERGLKDEPLAVVEATERYFKSQDLIGQFLSECFSVADPTNQQYTETKTDVYKRYLVWAEHQGLRKPMSKIALGRVLTDRGYKNVGTADRAEYEGLRLLLY